MNNINDYGDENLNSDFANSTSLWNFNCTNSFLNSTCNSTETETDGIAQENVFILPIWRQIVWCILFAGMVTVATIGNIVVIWIVLAHKRMRTVTNYFLVNLSVADLVVSTLNTTLNFIYMLYSHWPFGVLFCKVSQFVASLSICASVFTLMAISIDRYMAIMNPLKPRMGKKMTLCIAVSIWIFGIILSSPLFFFFTTYELKFESGSRVVCYAEWPDGSTNHSMQEYVYNVVFMFLTYFLPIGAMTFTYARVGIELWGSQSIGECTQRQLDNIKSKRKVVLMMMVVVIIFAVCWLPQNIYFLFTSYYPDFTTSAYVQEIYLGIYWLAMSNSMYNPIIYCWMNSRFRQGFKRFFRCCPFVEAKPDMLSRREAVTSRYSCSGSPDHRIIRNDTERSFLYSCAGSPKSHRKSHGSVKIPLQITTKSKQGTKSYITMSSYGNMKHNNSNHNPSGVTYEETEMMTNGDNNYSITTTTTTATPTTNQQFKTKFNAKKTSISSS